MAWASSSLTTSAELGRLPGALLGLRQLTQHGVEARFDLGRSRLELTYPDDEAFERRSVRPHLVTQLYGLGVRLVEVLEVAPQALEIVPRLLHAFELRRRLLRQRLDLRQPLADRLQIHLLGGELLRPGQQSLELLAQTIDARAERRQVPLAGAQRLETALGLTHRRLQHTHPLLIDLEALLLLPDPIERGAHLIHQRPPVLLESRGLAGHLVPHLGSALRLGGRVLDELLDARHRLLAAGCFLEPFMQLADLHVHRPDHLVEPVRLHRGPVDRVFLALQRFGLLRDMLGQRVERGELVLGRLAPMLELHQRAEPALDVLHRVRHRGGVLARRSGRVPQLRVVLAELSRGATHLLDRATQPTGLLDRLARLGL